MVILNDDTIDGKLAEPGLLVIKAYAHWCGPCKAIKPIIADLADEYSDSVEFAEVNIDDCPEIVKKLNITAMPSVFFFKDGIQIEKIIGAKQKSIFDGILKKLLT